MNEKKQVLNMGDGKWFRTIEEITARNGDVIPKGTALYVVDNSSTTKWWTVADESGKNREISKFEGAIPE